MLNTTLFQSVRTHFGLWVFLISGFIILLQCSPTDSNDDSFQKQMIVTLTVSDSIQTYDPWTTGSIQINEWAKPMYRIWIDMNGNPNDACTGNGEGPKQAEFWMDTGRLGFRWYGPDKILNTGDDVEYWPVQKVSETQWAEHGINAYISTDGKSLTVEFSLDMIGNPKTMEVSFMTSPWTTCCSDNLGTNDGNVPCWIVIPDAKMAYTYERMDNVGDNYWPNLVPNKRPNFDLIGTTIILQ